MSELIDALNQLEKEKHIDKDVIMEAIENSLVAACKRDFGNADNVVVNMDRETGDIVVYAEKEVVKPQTGKILTRLSRSVLPKQKQWTLNMSWVILSAWRLLRKILEELLLCTPEVSLYRRSKKKKEELSLIIFTARKKTLLQAWYSAMSARMSASAWMTRQMLF